MRTRPCITTPDRWRSLRPLERHRELRAAARLAHHRDRSLVSLDDLPRDRHAEPGALLFRREKRVEDPLDLVRRDAATVVAHADGRVVAAVLDEEVDAPPLGDRLEGIDRV